MKTFSITTLGCKVNQYESQQIREYLERSGLTQADIGGAGSDIVVVNTCCVTATASAKSRQQIRKARRGNPEAKIVATGCLAAVGADELNEQGENIHLIKNRETLAAKLNQIVKEDTTYSNLQSTQDFSNTLIRAKSENKSKCKNKAELGGITSFAGHTRAFLKVQDGCDAYCSYCVIVKTRPVVWSKPADAVIDEARGLVAAGYKEIVLTGIFLGAYGQETARRKRWSGGQNSKLAQLLERIAKVDGLARVRLSSLEPADVTQRLLDVFCENSNIMPHLHLSVQSGSDSVLKRMCRQYRICEVTEKIALIKEKLDRPAITGDFIVGFPGESDEDFEKSCQLASQVGFAKMHVFSYSARQGTPAAKMDGAVDNRVVKTRAARLGELDRQLQRQFREQFVGEEAVILTERSEEKVRGLSERYFGVEVLDGARGLGDNELVRVKLVENKEEGMTGLRPKRVLSVEF